MINAWDIYTANFLIGASVLGSVGFIIIVFILWLKERRDSDDS